jgi:hypothetical protein
MSKTLRPVINEQAQRYMQRAMELGGFNNPTEFVNTAIMMAYQHFVDQQHHAAGKWESQNWEHVKSVAEEMARKQLNEEPSSEAPAKTKGAAIG